MNKQLAHTLRQTEATLLENAAATVRGHGLEWNLLEIEPDPKGRGADAYVEIGNGGQKLRLAIEIKTHLRAGQVGAILAQFRQFDRPGLLITDYVNPQLAEELRRQRVFFVDTAGNLFLQGQGLLIWVVGRRDTQGVQVAREMRRAFQATGLRVIFALLSNPELIRENYRKLATTAGVALGTVQWVMRDLHEEGYVIREGRTKRRLVDLAKLLDEWALGYARDLKNRLLLGRFETGAFDQWRKVELRPYRAVWGGEPAAALITHYLKPQTLTIWVDKVPPRLLAEMGLRPAAKGPVEILARFWEPTVIGDPANAPVIEHQFEQADVAPPVLVYAELLAIGNARTVETAMKLRNEWIDGSFERYRADAAG
jgi:hypothetical protein